jgi:predicted dinucleotide-binding enzyme
MNTTVVGSRKFNGLARAHAGAAAAIRAKAAQQSEAVLLSVRWPSIDDALKACGPLDTKTVTDCTNPITPDLQLAFELTSSAAE